MAGSLSDWFCGQCGSGEVAFHPTGIESMPDSPCVFNVCETIAPTTRVISTNE